MHRNENKLPKPKEADAGAIRPWIEGGEEMGNQEFHAETESAKAIALDPEARETPIQRHERMALECSFAKAEHERRVEHWEETGEWLPDEAEVTRAAVRAKDARKVAKSDEVSVVYVRDALLGIAFFVLVSGVTLGLLAAARYILG